jgi:outer membrane lipoprotein SlyB
MPRRLHLLLLPLVLAAGLSACANSNAVSPGIQTASAPQQAATFPVGQNLPPQGQGQSGGYQGGGYQQAGQSQAAGVGEQGRVVSIREIDMKGGTPGPGSGPGRGTLIGGAIGGMGGAIAGRSIGGNFGGGLIGLVLGTVGGAIAGAIIDRGNDVGRGIEVVVQKDDGQTMTVAQRDDGDVQLGDRVVVVADRGGVAKAVRDTSRRTD